MRWIGATLASLSAMVIAILVARGVGSIRHLTTFEARLTAELTQRQDVWCWHAICPNLSSVVDVTQALEPYKGQVQQRYGNLYWEADTEPRWSASVQVISQPPSVFYIQLMPPQTRSTYTLGEAMLQFGTPVNVQVERDLKDWVLFVCFEHGACGGMLNPDLRLRPTQALVVINLSRGGVNQITGLSPPGFYAWHGLARIRRR